MSEVYVQLKLLLPADRADEIADILEESNGGVSDEEMFAHYGRLGEGVEEAIRESVEDEPGWVDPDLTPEEALAVQEFEREGDLVLIGFLVGDEGSSGGGWERGTGDDLIAFLSSLFDMAGIGVVDSFVYGEHEMEDLDDEILGLEEADDGDG